MTEASEFLHNMSSPSKSTVAYSGLSGKMDGAGSGKSRATGSGPGSGEFGTGVTFKLPGSVRGVSARYLLALCANGEGRGAPEKRLLRLIEARARELLLPEGAVVIPVREYHLEIYTELLSVLAVLTKCSASVWLRAKSPRLSALKTRREVSLLIPPAFAQNFEEILK